MAFTGDLEHLHIVDVIQLIHTTGKSGALAVKSDKGESRIIFSNGYIVGADHLNGKARIGSVLVKMNAVLPEDLNKALELQRQAGSRKPLMTTLMEMGKLGYEDALRGLKKLSEIMLVELIGWTKGTFTLYTMDTELYYPAGTMEQEVSIDTQMVLMDALRIFDEQKSDRQAGKDMTPGENLFAEALLDKETAAPAREAITAEDLGLADLDRLERKMPQSLPVEEIFDPAEIHRQKIKETLKDSSDEEQQAFVSFLRQSASGRNVRDASKRQEGRPGALILVSSDELLRHSVMTICKNEGVLVFSAGREEELDRIITQCLSIKTFPVLVFDDPKTQGERLSEEKVISLRRQIKKKYPQASIVQMASSYDFNFWMESFRDGVRAVFPKPSRMAKKETFIQDMIKFLETFKSYVSDLFQERREFPMIYQQGP